MKPIPQKTINNETMMNIRFSFENALNEIPLTHDQRVSLKADFESMLNLADELNENYCND